MAQDNNYHHHSSSKKFTSIIIVAVLILIQGILYLAASIWSFFVHKCRSIPNTQLGKVMHFIYLRDKACGEVLWTKTSLYTNTMSTLSASTTTTSTMAINIIPDMPNVTTVAFRTYIIILAYGIISGLWILTALLVLVGSCCSTAGKKTYHFCFTPWIIVVTLGSILDVIATVFHIYDIFHTTSPEKTLEYLNVKNIEEMMTEVSNYSKLFTYPAIILTCISCRLIIFWLINIIGVFLSSRRARIYFYRKSNESRISGSYEQQQVLPSQKDVLYDHREFSSKEPSLTCCPSPSSGAPIRGGERKTFEPFKPTTQPLSGIVYENKYHYNDTKYPESSRHKIDTTGGKRRSTTADELSRYDDMSPIAYRKFQHYSLSNPDHRLSLNPDNYRDHREEINNAVHLPTSNYRLSLQNNNPHKDRFERKHGIENVHITDELRGQLPWSYFNARDDIATAKRALTHTDEFDENDIMPPVPVPDYTYHFPKKERPSIKSDSDHELKSGGGGSGLGGSDHHRIMSTVSNSTKKSPNTRW